MINKELVKKLTESFLKEVNSNNVLNKDIIKETPERVAKGWLEMLSGYNINDKDLYKLFKVKNKNLVIIKNIEFASVCEHHLLPFTGVINIGYIPEDKVLGLSKFARIVDCFARRLQLQEKLVKYIADSIILNMQVKHLFIIAKATHSCMSCRGVNQKNSSTITFFSSGKFANYKENELLELIK